MNKEELKILIDNIYLISNKVPRGASHLSDALTFAGADLISYYRFDRASKDFEKALSFAKSIPLFTDFESEEFADWFIHDQEHLKYWPYY